MQSDFAFLWAFATRKSDRPASPPRKLLQGQQTGTICRPRDRDSHEVPGANARYGNPKCVILTRQAARGWLTFRNCASKKSNKNNAIKMRRRTNWAAENRSAGVPLNSLIQKWAKIGETHSA